jgi:hypothetical protein
LLPIPGPSSQFLNIADETGVGYTTARTGFHLGVYGNQHISGRFYLRPELSYSLQGTQYFFKITDALIYIPDEFMTARLNYSYLNIPVLVSFRIVDALHLELGPQLGILVRAKARFGSEFQDLGDYLNTFDLAAVAGARFELPAGLHLGARFNAGLVDIRVNNLSDKRTTNQVFQLSAGYSF